MQLPTQFIRDTRDRPVAVVLSYQEYERLVGANDAEDAYLSQLAREALEEGGDSIPLEVYFKDRFAKGVLHARGKARTSRRSRCN